MCRRLILLEIWVVVITIFGKSQRYSLSWFQLIRLSKALSYWFWINHVFSSRVKDTFVNLVYWRRSLHLAPLVKVMLRFLFFFNTKLSNFYKFFFIGPFLARLLRSKWLFLGKLLHSLVHILANLILHLSLRRVLYLVVNFICLLS